MTGSERGSVAPRPRRSRRALRRRRPPEIRARPVRSDTIHASIAHANEYNDAVLPVLGQEDWASRNYPWRSHRTPLSPPSQHARRARPAVDSPISQRGPEAMPVTRNAAKSRRFNKRRVEVGRRDQLAGGFSVLDSRAISTHRPATANTSYLRPRSLSGTSKKPRWPFTGCGSMRSINVRIQAIAPPSGRLLMAARSSATVIGRESTRFTTAIAHPAGCQRSLRSAEYDQLVIPIIFT